jgi:hypothetical protein
MNADSSAARIETYEDIKPLLDLCKAGKLFHVQEWIAAGKPVNPPPIPKKGRRGKSPLETAIERGFHSLIEVLLRAGAVIEPEGVDSPMNKALQLRRLDIVKLLVEHGFDPRTVDMQRVFDSWDPEIMTYFIERGADIETGRPFAYAFSNRIRTALRVYKQHVEQVPSLRVQADIALRHHCKEGNLKWISLLLWAGAEPWEPGPDSWEDERYEDDDELCALGFAALYGHFHVFEMRQIRAGLANPAANRFLRYLCKRDGVDMLKRMLESGLNPNDQENGGCSAIQGCLVDLGNTFYVEPGTRPLDDRGRDPDQARDILKAIHLLAKHGGKWIPKDKREITEARRPLLGLSPDYAVEFIWIMSKYQACTPDVVQALLSTPTIKRKVSGYSKRVQEIMSTWS